MKLLHAADLHLDSPMRGLARYDGAPVDQLRLATRQALANLVDLALEERVDALLIAGDVFDGDWQDHGTGACFAREMARLADADVPVVTIRGNHDAASRLTKDLRMPPNVRALPVDAPGTVLLEDLGLAVHGQGFATRAVSDDLSLGYPDPLAGYVNVGLLHTSADGRPGHERYAPCRPEALAARGYDYWALGHVHEREVLVDHPPVVFSGCLQGRHVKEAGPKGATLVTFDAGGRAALEPRVLDEVRWAVCTVDASDADLDEVHSRLGDALAACADEAEGRLLAVRVRFTGASAAHAGLLADADQLRTEVVLAAEGATAGAAWVEKVVVATSPRVAADPAGDDALAEIARTVRDARSEDGLAALAAELGPLVAKLPPAVREGFDPAAPDVVAGLLDDVERLLPARLGRAPA